MTTRHSNQILTFWVAAYLSILCGFSSLTSAASMKMTSDNQLARAKTIRLKEVFSVADNKGVVHPFFDVTVDIHRPDELRIEATPVWGKGDRSQKKSFYLMSKGKQYEYDGITNTYTTGTAPAPGSVASSQLWDMAAVTTVLYPDESIKTEPDMTISSSKGTLNGRKMIVFTDKFHTLVESGKRITPVYRIWVDASTGYPCQKCEYIDINGKDILNLKLDMFDYVLNKPLPKGTFVWKAPAGAKLDNPPTLLNPGSVAPYFTAYKADGTAVHLSDFKGKTVVLDFWATWCGPCQASLPHLEKIYRQVNNQNVVVLAVCVWDTHDAFEKWIVAKNGMYTFNLLFDPAGKSKSSIATALYHVTEIPTQYVIGKDGKILANDVGYEPGAHMLEDTLRKSGVTVSETRSSHS